MNGFLLGSTTMGILGLVGYTFSSNESAEFRDLTQATLALMEAVAESYDPPTSSQTLIPFRDVISIYVNSRGNRNWVNQRQLETNSQAYAILLKQMEEDHRLIKRLALACLVDGLLDKLAPNCHSTRHEKLLWLYADEQGVLGQIAEFCSPQDRQFISTRV